MRAALWSHVWVDVEGPPPWLDDPPLASWPPPLRDGWLRRSASALTKRLLVCWCRPDILWCLDMYPEKIIPVDLHFISRFWTHFCRCEFVRLTWEMVKTVQQWRVKLQGETDFAKCPGGIERWCFRIKPKISLCKSFGRDRNNNWVFLSFSGDRGVNRCSLWRRNCRTRQPKTTTSRSWNWYVFGVFSKLQSSSRPKDSWEKLLLLLRFRCVTPPTMRERFCGIVAVDWDFILSFCSTRKQWSWSSWPTSEYWSKHRSPFCSVQFWKD